MEDAFAWEWNDNCWILQLQKFNTSSQILSRKLIILKPAFPKIDTKLCENWNKQNVLLYFQRASKLDIYRDIQKTLKMEKKKGLWHSLDCRKSYVFKLNTIANCPIHLFAISHILPDKLLTGIQDHVNSVKFLSQWAWQTGKSFANLISCSWNNKELLFHVSSQQWRFWKKCRHQAYQRKTDSQKHVSIPVSCFMEYYTNNECLWVQ